VKNNRQIWHTPSAFASLDDRSVKLSLGAALLEIGHLQMHVHRVNSPTPPHSHPQYQLLYYPGGNGEQTVGELREKVQPHSLFLIPPGTAHAFSPRKGTETQAFSLRFDAVAEEAENHDARVEDGGGQVIRLLCDRRPRAVRLQAKAAREAARLLAAIRDESLGREFGHELAVQGNLLLLLQVFFRAAAGAEKEPPPPTRAGTVFLIAKTWIDQRLDEDIAVGDAARYCHVSESYLQKIFREVIGRAFSAYVREQRLERAAYLLRTTELSVKEIAVECGIPDQNYFARQFRRSHGTSPSAFRTRHNS